MRGRHARWRSAVFIVSFAASACDRTATVERTEIADEHTPAHLAPLVDELMPGLERLSGLDRREKVRVRAQDRGAVRQFVERRLQQELPPEQLEGVRAVYSLLGLVADTLDLRALLLDLYTEQVLGYYDPDSRTLYVVGDASRDALVPVLAHELVHALQDQHTNLDSLISRERGNDRQTAAHAAMEGHAMIVMLASLHERAARRRIDPTALPSPAGQLGPALAAQNEQFPVFRRAPDIIRETLLFPYIGGSDFVHTLWSQRRGAARYPAPIDSFLPQSTLQVMEPLEHFIRRRTEPIEIRLDGAGTASGSRNENVQYENTLGRLETGIFLGQHLGAGARASASAWRGDRYIVIGENGVRALRWISVWDSDDSAQRFARAIRSIAGRRPDRSTTANVLQLNGHAAVDVLDVPVTATSLRERLATIAPRVVPVQAEER